MYHAVQCFALWLKIDIYFQIVLLICTAIVTKRLAFQIICIVMVLLVSASLVFSRISITKESNWMMFVFLFLQMVLLACNVYSLIGLFEYSVADLWFTGIIYGNSRLTKCSSRKCRLISFLHYRVFIHYMYHCK